MAQNATSKAVISCPCSHISSTPPRIVVLTWRPTTEIPIKGVVLATIRVIAAATAKASVRSKESGLLAAIVWPHRGQRALRPGGRMGIRCNRSHPGHATISSIKDDDIRLFLWFSLDTLGIVDEQDDPFSPELESVFSRSILREP